MPAAGQAMNAPHPPSPALADATASAVVGAPIAHDSAALHVAGARALHRRPARAPRHAARRGRRKSRSRTARCAASTSTPCARRRVSSRSSRRPTFPASTTSDPSCTTIPSSRPTRCEFAGQPVFAVAATSVHAARRAARLARFDLVPLPALLTIDDALRAKSYVLPPVHVTRGDAATALARAPHRLRGQVAAGGQDHFYLEGQIALAIPRETRRHADLHVHAAPGRSAAHGRACARARRARRRRGVPADGRRLRRQGNADVALRLRGGARRAQDRPRRQGAPRSRRRHALHRQAARLPVRVRRRLSTIVAASSAST